MTVVWNAGIVGVFFARIPIIFHSWIGLMLHANKCLTYPARYFDCSICSVYSHTKKGLIKKKRRSKYSGLFIRKEKTNACNLSLVIVLICDFVSSQCSHRFCSSQTINQILSHACHIKHTAGGNIFSLNANVFTLLLFETSVGML